MASKDPASDPRFVNLHEQCVSECVEEALRKRGYDIDVGDGGFKVPFGDGDMYVLVDWIPREEVRKW